MIPGASLAALWLLVLSTRCTVAWSLGRTVKAVELPGGHMEMVQEIACSDSLLRLTCRSLRAFIFVLEAEYHSEDDRPCGYEPHGIRRLRYENRKRGLKPKSLRASTRDALKANYFDDEEEKEEEEENEEDSTKVDLRTSLNRRCSGQHHCRFSIPEHHPGGKEWNPATIRLKYACIPETAVHRYCNAEVTVKGGEGGYIKSPGYPLYYPGEYACGWTFETIPGQRVALVFHDLSIRGREPNGRCVDIVRIRENGRTLFETCGTSVGTSIVSTSNRLTLNLISSSRLYPARGFLLRYKAVGCPEVDAPNGSYVSNDTLDSRTFRCNDRDYIFPDTKTNTKILDCRDGRWNETVETLQNSCVVSSTAILKIEEENSHLSSLSGDDTSGSGVRIGRGEDAVADGTNLVMDSAQPAVHNHADFGIDVLLPTILIALLIAGNMVIVYVIFQYRKRKIPEVVEGEDISLSPPAGVPQV